MANSIGSGLGGNIVSVSFINHPFPSGGGSQGTTQAPGTSSTTTLEPTTTILCEPVPVNGFYPLYTSEQCAVQSGNGTFHTHTLNGVLYFMPNGVEYWHGDYSTTTTSTTGEPTTSSTTLEPTTSTSTTSTSTTPGLQFLDQEGYAGFKYNQYFIRDSELWSLGKDAQNIYGELGFGFLTNPSNLGEVSLTSMTEVEFVAGGGDRLYVIKDDGSVWAVGRNTNGELGDGTQLNSINFIKIFDGEDKNYVTTTSTSTTSTSTTEEPTTSSTTSTTEEPTTSTSTTEEPYELKVGDFIEITQEKTKNSLDGTTSRTFEVSEIHLVTYVGSGTFRVAPDGVEYVFNKLATTPGFIVVEQGTTTSTSTTEEPTTSTTSTTTEEPTTSTSTTQEPTTTLEPLYWSPSNSSEIVGWWDASDSSTITTSGTEVQSVIDKSGNGYTLTKGTTGATYGTRTLNGLNVFDFNGVNGNVLENNSFSWDQASNALGFACVYRLDDDGNDSEQDFLLSGTNTSTRIGMRRLTNNQWQLLCSGGSITTPTSLGAEPVTQMMVTRFNGSNSSISIDGNIEVSGEIGSVPFSSLNISGNYMHQQGVEGFVAEVLFFSDLTETQKVEGYLAHKWGLTASLPTSHPYKTSEPV